MFSGQDALYTALAAVLVALPRLLAAVVILVAGWIISGLLGKLVQKLAERLGTDRLTRRARIDSVLEQLGVRHATAGGVLALVVTWCIRVVVLGLAAEAAGIGGVQTLLHGIALYLANVVVALVILAIGAYVARVGGDAVRRFSDSARWSNGPVLAAVVQFGVLFLALDAALAQLHVAEFLVDALLVAILFAASLAAGLAFGLGGRSAAGRLVDSMSTAARDASDTVRSRNDQEAPDPWAVAPSVVRSPVRAGASSADAQRTAGGLAVADQGGGPRPRDDGADVATPPT
ncbi:MAG: hypothetical protein ABR541_09550 [Candidatus Dormibacteria bacterium]